MYDHCNSSTAPPPADTSDEDDADDDADDGADDGADEADGSDTSDGSETSDGADAAPTGRLKHTHKYFYSVFF